MKITEIFYSIQGEGQWTGQPNIFIRTTGCNLRCHYCDTKYAYDNGREMDIDDIYLKIKKYPCKKICITGGEPLIQEEILDLINKLMNNNYKICIETNGSIDIKNVIDYKTIIISLDIKCPSSEMNDKMDFSEWVEREIIPKKTTSLRNSCLAFAFAVIWAATMAGLDQSFGIIAIGFIFSIPIYFYYLFDSRNFKCPNCNSKIPFNMLNLYFIF